MDARRKISLLTLLGVVLPFGHIWGPFLMRVPKESRVRGFRFKLVLFEILLTVIFFAISIIMNIKAINSGCDSQTLSASAAVLMIHCLVIIATAVILAFVAPRMVKKDA